MHKRTIMTIMILAVPLLAGGLAKDFGSYIRWLAVFCFGGGAAFGWIVYRLRTNDPVHRNRPPIEFLSKGGPFISENIEEPNRTILLMLLYGVCASLAWAVFTAVLPEMLLEAFLRYIENT